MPRVSIDKAIAALRENYEKLTPLPTQNPRDHNFSLAMLGIAEGIKDLQDQVKRLEERVSR